MLIGEDKAFECCHGCERRKPGCASDCPERKKASIRHALYLRYAERLRRERTVNYSPALRERARKEFLKTK